MIWAMTASLKGYYSKVMIWIHNIPTAVPITTDLVNSNLNQGEVYNIM
jgi:hypothetical protein